MKDKKEVKIRSTYRYKPRSRRRRRRRRRDERNRPVGRWWVMSRVCREGAAEETLKRTVKRVEIGQIESRCIREDGENRGGEGGAGRRRVLRGFKSRWPQNHFRPSDGLSDRTVPIPSKITLPLPLCLGLLSLNT